MSTGWVVPPEEEVAARASDAVERPEPVEPLLEGVATWSTAKILPLAVTIGIALAIFVFWVSPDPVMIEWQLTLLALAICFAAFLTVGLYRGVQLARPKRKPRLRLPGGLWDVTGFELPNVGGDMGEGCLVLLHVIVFVVVLGIALQLLLVILPPILYGLYLASDRLLRRVFAGPRTCTGSWLGSLKLGVAYSGYAVGLVYGATWLVRAAWLFATRH